MEAAAANAEVQTRPQYALAVHDPGTTSESLRAHSQYPWFGSLNRSGQAGTIEVIRTNFLQQGGGTLTPDLTVAIGDTALVIEAKSRSPRAADLATWQDSFQFIQAFEEPVEVGMYLTSLDAWGHSSYLDYPLYYPQTSDERFSVLANQIRELMELPEGWYDGASVPPSREAGWAAIALAAELLTTETPIPTVVPLTDGGVQLEWHRGGLEVEIEIDSSGASQLYVTDIQTGDEWEGSPVEGFVRFGIGQRLAS